jgi:hypothetical protein
MRLDSFLRAVALSLGAALVVGCSEDTDVVRVTPADDIFASYVNLGNSVGAGFQSAGITTETQRQGYAPLLAAQMHTRFALPLLREPGCPPPLVDFTTGARKGGGTGSTCLLRDPASATAVINNVAVPGAKSGDPGVVNGPSANVLTTLFLGGKSQVDRALEANPTFATVEVIGNDLLGAVGSGILAGAGGARTYTPAATYRANLSPDIDKLVAGGAKAGVLFAHVNLLRIPVVVPAAVLQNPLIVFAIGIYTGKTVVVDQTTCTATTTSLLSIQLLDAIRTGQHPPQIACAKGGPFAPVGDAFVLDAAEQAQITQVTNDYNAWIKAKADSIGYVFYDVNASIEKARAAGQILTIPALTDPHAPFGTFFSRDPIHPSALGQKQVANDLIDLINAKYGTSLAKVP